MENVGLESVNCFLFDIDLCQQYYNNLKETLMSEGKVKFKMKYLNISHMPKAQSLEYFNSFKMVENVYHNLKKLDLSNNKLDCKTFFIFINDNQKFENLRTLNLNANDIDDSFFEKKNFQDMFCRLDHLYLNSNKIGDMNTNLAYQDNIPIDEKYQSFNAKKLIYKLRLIYHFFLLNKHLTKLTIKMMKEILLISDLIVNLISIKIPPIIHIAISLLFIKVNNYSLIFHNI